MGTNSSGPPLVRLVGPRTVTRIGDSYWVATPEWTVEFAQLREHGDGVTAEVTTALLSTGASHWGRVSLASPISRQQFVKAATQACSGVDWATILNAACHGVVKAERAGDPAVELVPTRPDPARWLVPDLFPLGETSVLYGDGSTLKSLLAEAIGVAGLTGRPIAGLARWAVAPLRGVLYLDWETQQAEHAARLWHLTAASLAEPLRGFHYRPMHRPLTEMLSAIRREVALLGIDLVIADSLGVASGSEPESADAAVRTMTALRSLAPASRVVIAHVSKVAAEAQRHARPYGSVYIRNLARATLEATRPATEPDPGEPGETAVTITYRHDKLNNGPLLPLTALRWVFDRAEGIVTVQPGDVAPERLGLPAQILRALGAEPQSVQALAEDLSTSPMQIRARLAELKRTGRVVRFSDSGGGRGNKTLWARADTKRTGSAS